MECVQYIQAQLKQRGSINIALERARQAGAITPDADKTTRLALDKVCDVAEAALAENKRLKQQLGQVQQGQLF